MSRSVTQDHQLGYDREVTRQHREWELTATTFFEAPPAPCITYACTSQLLVTNISSNTFELIGIRPESVVGKQVLWDERLFPEDRARFLARLDQLGPSEAASEAHRVIDDQGSSVWVAHSFRKMQVGRDCTILGCMLPLGGAVSAITLDTSLISQFIHKIGNHFQLMNLLIGSLKRTGSNLDGVEALQQTIDQAVEFTRAFSNYTQSPAYATRLDLAEILHSVIASATPSCVEKNVGFHHVIENSLSESEIIGDPLLLEFAFGSVLKNAIEATKDGDQIYLTAKAELSGVAERPSVRISFRDTGVGMDADALSKAAAPFVTSKRDQHGLGLSAAVRVIEIHGGALKISSTLGVGTQVEISLPTASRWPTSGDPKAST